MGLYYRYVNWDLKEYFGVDAGGFNGKLSGAGYTPASRILALLLVDGAGSPRADHGSSGSDESPDVGGRSIVGRWHRSRISLEHEEADVGDDFIDVSADALIMLCLRSDLRSITELLEYEHFFLEVAHLVATWQMPAHVRTRVEEVLGDGYQARYQALAKGRPYALPTVQLPQTLSWFDES